MVSGLLLFTIIVFLRWFWLLMNSCDRTVGECLDGQWWLCAGQTLLEPRELGVLAACLHRVTRADGKPDHRRVGEQGVGDHAPDARCRGLSLQPVEQGAGYAASLPAVCNGDGELAGLAIVLVDDVSCLADHDLALALEHLGQQRQMAVVVDERKAIR